MFFARPSTIYCYLRAWRIEQPMDPKRAWSKKRPAEVRWRDRLLDSKLPDLDLQLLHQLKRCSCHYALVETGNVRLLGNEGELKQMICAAVLTQC